MKPINWMRIMGMATVAGLVWATVAGPSRASAQDAPRLDDARLTRNVLAHDVLTPYEWEFAGQLFDAAGTPLSGLRTLEIRLFDAATNGWLRWGCSVEVMANEEGRFTAVLSDALPRVAGVPQSVLLRKVLREVRLWVEVKVAGHSEAIAPRQALVAAPYAMFANAIRFARADFGVKGMLFVLNTTTTENFTATAMTALNAWNVTGTLTVGGNLTAEQGVSASAYVGLGAVPVGTIILWFGSTNSLPAGWAPCDGTSGTPDLRQRFVVGAGKAYTLGAQGGAASVAITQNEMPAHGHGYELRNNGNRDSASGIDRDDDVWHGDSSSTTSSSGGSGGSASAHENRPPYRALHYIMRVN